MRGTIVRAKRDSLRVGKKKKENIKGRRKKKFFFFLATPEAYGSSQDGGHIGATAAGLCHSHSNETSQLLLRPQLMVTPDP